MDISKLPEELKERMNQCANSNELIELAHKEGIELSDEQMDQIAGGGWGSSSGSDDGPWEECRCPDCGKYTIYNSRYPFETWPDRCRHCGAPLRYDARDIRKVGSMGS